MAQSTTLRACSECGTDISDRHYNAKRCTSCGRRRPSTYVVETKICLPCGGTFTSGNKKRRYCGSACRQWDENHPGVPRPASPDPTSPPSCGWCSVDISHLGSRAEYCSQQHKKNAASKRHRDRNPDYYRNLYKTPARFNYMKGYRAANATSIRAKAREARRAQRIADPEGVRSAAQAWREANREWCRLREQNRRASKLNNPDSIGVSERDWLKLVRRYRGCCAYCGKRPDSLHMDHVIPLKRFGRHAIGNVLPACKPCNSSKNARLLADWKYRS